MDFDFTEDQIAIADAVRRYAEDKLAPEYQAREIAGKIDRALLKEMGDLGFIGAELPTEFGGLGLDAVTAGVIVEQIARADFNVSYVQLLASLNGSLLAQAAPDLAADIVPGVCAGELILGLGLTEPGGGSDAGNLQLRADLQGDKYILSGEKASISFASQSDFLLLFARTGTPEEKAKGVSAFLVPMDLPGITATDYDDLGTRAVGRGSIFFDQVELSAKYLIGEEGKGFGKIMHGFDYSRALIALQCLAPAMASMEETWQYTTERHAFGLPIAKYQGVTEPLAVFDTQLLAAQLLAYKTLWLRDQGRPHTKEAAMLKWWGPKLAYDAIHQCLLTHGHMGYTKELPHQQRLRDVLGLQIGDGTAQIQKMIIARETVGRVAVPYG
ncbi:MAG: cyclohexanecarboxyl-CoA dehydrogenase [Gammaproteobacteria bacterium]|nr:MAG: cyclohexanecarboxyl-CoA dehydrogenase [Gammaproteobacteria bacterium]RLA15428.1 MAG: cyclohexanecarboxyl-CoA dehydrogenase [Gammaproteobacteria bacterium]RLA18011.1 MAG: cyclohexanecarboxyl-CoA dehydrogenase [Gammaproteobacteria bacterium]